MNVVRNALINSNNVILLQLYIFEGKKKRLNKKDQPRQSDDAHVRSYYDEIY